MGLQELVENIPVLIGAAVSLVSVCVAWALHRHGQKSDWLRQRYIEEGIEPILVFLSSASALFVVMNGDREGHIEAIGQMLEEERKTALAKAQMEFFERIESTLFDGGSRSSKNLFKDAHRHALRIVGADAAPRFPKEAIHRLNELVGHWGYNAALLKILVSFNRAADGKVKCIEEGLDLCSVCREHLQDLQRQLRNVKVWWWSDVDTLKKKLNDPAKRGENNE